MAKNDDNKPIEGVYEAAVKSATPGDTSKPSPGEINAAEIIMGNLVARLKEASTEYKKLKDQFEDPKTNLPLKERLSIQTDMIEAERAHATAQIAVGQMDLDALEVKLKINGISIDNLELLEESTDAQAREYVQLYKSLKAHREREQSLRLQNRYFNQMDTAIEGIAKTSFGLAYSWENSIFKAVRELGKKGGSEGFDRVKLQITGIFDKSEILYSFSKKIVEATILWNKELIDATATLNKATGMAQRFEGHINETATTFYRFGLSMGDAATHIGSLVDGFSDFTSLSETKQRHLIKTSAQLAALGIGAEDFAQSLTFLTRNMGYSDEVADKLNKNLVVFAESIGMAPNRFMKEFAATIPKLEVYGSRAIEVFKSLEKQSKASGVGIDKLMSATAKMDTFEGAAQTAGHLNAALGGAYFDSLELLMAKEDERIDIIKNTINSTGLQFDQLGRFQKRLLATAAGFEEVAEFERVLNGETDHLAGRQKEFNEVIEASATLLTNMKVIMMSLAKSLMFIIKPLTVFTGWIAKSQGWSVAFASVLFLAIPLAIRAAAGWIAKMIFKLATLNLSLAKTTAEAMRMNAALGGGGGGGPHAPYLTHMGAPRAASTQTTLPGRKKAGRFRGAKGGMGGLAMMGAMHLLQGGGMDASAIGGLIGGGLGIAAGALTLNPYIGFLASTALSTAGAGIGSYLAGMNGGGIVPGADTTRDSVAMALTPGEMVIPRNNVSDFEKILGDLTNAVNKLNSEGGKPVHVVLKVDGKKLASAVHNNTEYITV